MVRTDPEGEGDGGGGGLEHPWLEDGRNLVETWEEIDRKIYMRLENG